MIGRSLAALRISFCAELSGDECVIVMCGVLC
jgi:hypothetical protein